MSYDIASGANSQLTRSSGTFGLISMAWVKYLEFVNVQEAWFYVFGFGSDVGSGTGGGAFTGSSVTDLVGFCQNNNNGIISSGSDSSWVFICIVQVVGVGLTVYWRHEGEKTLSSVSVSDSGVSGGGNYALCTSFFNANHKRLSSYKEWTNANDLTVAQIFAESIQSAPIKTTNNLNWLSCAVGSTVGTDQSAASQNWTVSGTTITLNADEPVMSLPGSSSQDLVVCTPPAMAMGFNF